jgi:hypothetical protein
MSENITRVSAGVINRHDLEVGWLANTTFIPQRGELILYDSERDANGNALALPEDRTVPYDYARLKLGDGVNTATELPFVHEWIIDRLEVIERAINNFPGADDLMLPKPISTSIILDVDSWTQVLDDNNDYIINTYSQVIVIDGATSNSRIDLQPSPAQLTEFYDLGVILTTENTDGVITVYSIGVKPTKTYTMQVTVTEISLENAGDLA